MATKSKTTSRAAKKQFANKPKLNLGLIAVIAGVLALVGTFAVLLSQAATTTTNYVLPNGTTIARRFPGDPNPKVSGKAYWGSALNGNADPSPRYEQVTGNSLSVRRTYWGWDNNRTSMITTIKADLAANRLPWVSTKTPAWADVAAGKYDTDLDAMLKATDATGGPVWLTIYHEPEDNTNSGTGREKCEKTVPVSCSGTATDWRNMQKHFRDRMTALGTKNITLAPILMSWTWDTRSGRTPSDYWVAGIWDFEGVDHYQESTTGAIADMTAWKNFISFTEAKGLPYGIGEWGTHGSDATAAQRMQDFWNWSVTNKKDLVAYAYFDSNLNSSSGGWELFGPQLTLFQNILKTDARVQRIKDLGKPATTTSTVTPTTTSTITPPPTTTVIPVPTSTITPTTTVTPTVTVTPTPTTTVSPVTNPASKTKQ